MNVWSYAGLLLFRCGFFFHIARSYIGLCAFAVASNFTHAELPQHTVPLFNVAPGATVANVLRQTARPDLTRSGTLRQARVMRAMNGPSQTSVSSMNDLLEQVIPEETFLDASFDDELYEVKQGVYAEPLLVEPNAEKSNNFLGSAAIAGAAMALAAAGYAITKKVDKYISKQKPQIAMLAVESMPTPEIKFQA